MNYVLPVQINKNRIVKTMIFGFVLFCFLPIAFNITCLKPIYFTLENNTLYRGTAITLTLKYIMDLFDLISFGSLYAAVIFSLTLLKKKVTVLLSLSYISLLLLKIPASLLMNIPLYGTIGTKNEIIADLISLSFYFLLELLQFLFVLIFAATTTRRYLRAIEFLNSKKDINIQNSEHILPIKKFINWYNPLLRASIFSSITVLAFRVLSRLVTDIGAGAPTSFAETMIIIINYLTDAIYGAVIYIIAILIFNLLFDKLTK